MDATFSRRVLITQYGPATGLRVVRESAPQAAPGRVVVRMLACGVAYGDILKRLGRMPGMPQPPYTPGYDLVGEVVASWPGGGFKPGERVAAIVMNGANADHVLVRADELVRLPVGLDPVRAAAAALNYVTAWQMLRRVAGVRSGERALVHGAGGGMGTALLDVGRSLGLQLYGTASAGKHALVREYGATPIDYRTENFVTVCQAFPGGGADLVLDGIGGCHLWRSFSALKAEGRLLAYGIAAAAQGGRLATVQTVAITSALQLARSRRTWFYTILPNRVARWLPGVWSSRRKEVAQDLAEILAATADGTFNPRIGAILPLDRAAEAHALVENAAVGGKVVLIP